MKFIYLLQLLHHLFYQFEYLIMCLNINVLILLYIIFHQMNLIVHILIMKFIILIHVELIFTFQH